jgi:hypothetical protein
MFQLTLPNSNLNPRTGINYGYISSSKLEPSLVDYLLDSGTNLDLIRYLDEHEEDDPEGEYYKPYQESIQGTHSGVLYATSYLKGALNFFIFESPHTGYYPLCSSCVPGAGNLDLPQCQVGIKCYDVPLEWRLKPELSFNQSLTENKMQSFKLKLTNAADITFNGVLIASKSTTPESAHPSYSGRLGEWEEYDLYRTESGKYICYLSEMTQHQGCKNKYSYAICATTEEVINFFGNSDMAQELYRQALINNETHID